MLAYKFVFFGGVCGLIQESELRFENRSAALIYETDQLQLTEVQML